MSSRTHNIDPAMHPEQRQYGTAPNSDPHGTYGVAGADAPGPAYPAGSVPAQHQPLQHQPQVAGAGVNPHHSNAMNTVDPRVASGTTAPAGHYNGTTGAAGHGAAIPSGHHYQHPGTQSTATGPAPHTAGPHHSDMMNRLDPTVDNNLSKTGHTGPNHVPAAAHAPASAGHNTTGPTSAHGPTHGAIPATTRHGADISISATHGPTQGIGTTTGSGAQRHHHGTGGPHRSGIANTLDPNVDSTLPGPAPHTGGPHRHDILNKLDPTVDSKTGLRK